jgi:hypothetical protein
MLLKGYEQDVVYGFGRGLLSRCVVSQKGMENTDQD